MCFVKTKKFDELKTTPRLIIREKVRWKSCVVKEKIWDLFGNGQTAIL